MWRALADRSVGKVGARFRAKGPYNGDLGIDIPPRSGIDDFLFQCMGKPWNLQN